MNLSDWLNSSSVDPHCLPHFLIVPSIFQLFLINFQHFFFLCWKMTTHIVINSKSMETKKGNCTINVSLKITELVMFFIRAISIYYKIQSINSCNNPTVKTTMAVSPDGDLMQAFSPWFRWTASAQYRIIFVSPSFS